MNIYTVRKATQGFANYLIKNNKSKGIAIAYDSRIKSDVFAKEAPVFWRPTVLRYIYIKN